MTSFPVLTATALFSILFAVGCHRQTASSPDIIVVHGLTLRVGLTTIALGLLTVILRRPAGNLRLTSPWRGDMSHPGMATHFRLVKRAKWPPGRYQES